MDTVKLIEEMVSISPLMVRINRWVNQCLAVEDEATLAPTQMQAIMILKGQDSLNMTQLAELMRIPRQQLTKVVDALVSKGLVERKTDPNNRRAILIELSEEGQAYIYELFCNGQKKMMKFVELLNERQREELFHSLATLKRIITELEFPG